MRPEYLKCIADSHADNAGKSWCGMRLFGFHFVNAEHAAQNGRNEGRSVACPECVQAIKRALANGQ